MANLNVLVKLGAYTLTGWWTKVTVVTREVWIGLVKLDQVEISLFDRYAIL